MLHASSTPAAPDAQLSREVTSSQHMDEYTYFATKTHGGTSPRPIRVKIVPASVRMSCGSASSRSTMARCVRSVYLSTGRSSVDVCNVDGGRGRGWWLSGAPEGASPAHDGRRWFWGMQAAPFSLTGSGKEPPEGAPPGLDALPRLIRKAAAQRSCAVRVDRTLLELLPFGRARRYLLIQVVTSTGLGAIAGAGAGRACRRSPVRAQGNGDVDYALGRLETQSAEGERAPSTHATRAQKRQ
eukprot:3495255-Pleurochrysis_carterae.AAC.8